MSQAIDILRSLGINGTVFVQFGIFFVAYLAMSRIAFLPYLSRHQERLRRTVGDQKVAGELHEQSAQKEDEYKAEAKALNARIKEIFQREHAKARAEADGFLAKAQKDAEVATQKARQELMASVEQARQDLESHIPTLSQNIQNKFVRH